MPACHRLQQFFVMGEVAMQLFQQPPNAFVQELRKGKYPKTISTEPDILQAVVQLSLEVEGSANHAGVMLLPPATVEALLQDKRRLDLLQSFKVALLKLASQVTHAHCRQAVDALRVQCMGAVTKRCCCCKATRLGRCVCAGSRAPDGCSRL